MSRRNSAPTHGWVISSQVTKWLSGLFIIFLVAFLIAAYTIKYTVDRDCTDYYKRDTGVAGYWVHIEIGSTDRGCPAPYDQ